MAIIEINRGQVRFARSNQSYRDFMIRHFNFRINDKAELFHDKPRAVASPFMKALIESSKYNRNLFVDEELASGVSAHSCLRRLAVNPVTGTTAIAVAVLSVTDNKNGTSYANIARALAADYFSLYYVNIEDETFFEYASDAWAEKLAMERHDVDFFNKSREDALTFLYHEDREKFVKAFTKENVIGQINECGIFTITYRLLIKGEPVYVNMKASRMKNDAKHIIIGVSNVDMQMKQKEMLEKIKRNELTYNRIMALSGNYLCIYAVDADTEDYVEYIAAESYQTLGFAKYGKNFFTQAWINSASALPKEELLDFKEKLTRENLVSEIEKNGVFTMNYHVIISGETIAVGLRAALVNEDTGPKFIIGVFRLDTH